MIPFPYPAGPCRRVAVYCRVSTEQELQAGSLETQMNACRDLVLSRPGLELVAVYGDRGKTGRNTRRPAFQRMLRDCEAGQVDLILAKSLSRFARNVGDCVAVVRRLKALGVTVLFEKEGISTGDERSELLLSVLAALSEEESNSISQNLLWANEQHNACGKPFFRPSYGYCKARRDWQWHIEESQARRVRFAFREAAGGRCYAAIRRGLNAMEASEGTGETWSLRRLKYLLGNVNYTGDCLTNKTVPRGRSQGSCPNDGRRPQYLIEDHHEPLVSREVFSLVQEKLRTGALHSRDMSHLNPRKGQ